MTDPPAPRDPVTREVIRSSLVAAADSMAVTVVRTARSAVVKDGMDFSTAVFNGAGEQVAQGLTLPFHMGAMQPALDGVLAQFGGDVKPGDILASNDPYSGASHLPDIFLFKPVFAERTLIAWLCVIAHHTDIGGRVAGGNACDNTEIYQEGLRLPPLKLFAAGQRNDAVWRIIGTNVRVPALVHGDLLAQVAALEQGEQDLLALAAAHGNERLDGYMSDIIEHTERRTRAEIAALPDGSWSFSDFIDGDGIRPEPIEIRVRVTIAGDEFSADFAGTSPQATGSINPNLPFTTSAVYAVLKTLTDPSIDANAGFFRPIAVRAPPGCFVNPQHPAAVAARGLGGFRVAQAVFGALAKALPDRVPAAWGGGEFGVSFGGYYADGRAFVFLEFNNDGPRGGGPHADGADGLTAPVHNMANTPIETIEAAQPLLILRYGFVPDTGGPGPLPRRPGAGARVPAHARRGQPAGPLRPRPVSALGHAGRLIRDGRRQSAQPGPGRRRRTAAGQVPAHADARRRLPAGAAGRRRLRRSAGARSGGGAGRRGARQDQRRPRARRLRRGAGCRRRRRHLRHHRAAGAPQARPRTACYRAARATR